MSADRQDEVQVTDNPERSRYEARIGDEVAGFVDYRRDGEGIVLVYTEVDPEHEGKGIGSALARGALDDVRAHRLSLTPECGFIKGYIDRHPEYQDLVAR